MSRLYQWLSGRASFFSSHTSGRGTNRTVRTEVTVERQGMTLVVGGAATGFDTCPLCGSQLAPAQVEPPDGRLVNSSIPYRRFPVEGASPCVPKASEAVLPLGDASQDGRGSNSQNE